MQALLDDLRAIVGEAHVLVDATDGDALAAYERDWRKRYQIGRAHV